MVKFIKTVCVFLFVAAVCVFGIVGYGMKTIPDEINVLSDRDVVTEDIFTVERSADSTLRQTGAGLDTLDSYSVDISFMNIIPVKTSRVSVSQRHYVVPGGDIFGLKMYSDGVMVVGMSDVLTESGAQNPAKNSGLQIGDIIIGIDGVKIDSSAQTAEIFSKSAGKEMTLSVLRNTKAFQTTVTAVYSPADGVYKIGIWIRDSAAGIGTITYFDPTSKIYGSLGHAVCDEDTGNVIPILNGEAVSARITGCYKGKSGTAGELCGVFTGGSLGSILINGNKGVYGLIDTTKLESRNVVPVATRSEIKEGKAQIISTVDGNKAKYYDIEITKIYKDTDTVRNMAVKVTDSELIEKTGGIVQGMSGSPIIQNGMLVGAITHVFVNDSLQGYAIFAENMISVSDELYDAFYSKAS